MQQDSPSGRGERKGGASRRSPDEGDRPKGGKRRPLTPEAILGAAIRIADAEGLGAVSVRRVAAELHARPMSLYRHFASKDELLAAMTNVGVGKMLVQQPLPEDWRAAVATSARQMYLAFITHSWLFLIFAQRPAPGPNTIKLAKQMARAVSSLQLTESEVWLVQGIVNDYVFGFSFRTVGGASGDAMEAAISSTDIVEFPELASLPDDMRTRTSMERLEVGLQTVFDGVERRFMDTGH